MVYVMDAFSGCVGIYLGTGRNGKIHFGLFNKLRPIADRYNIHRRRVSAENLIPVPILRDMMLSLCLLLYHLRNQTNRELLCHQ